MDWVTSDELRTAAGINKRRFEYLRKLFDKVFPVPVRTIGRNQFWQRDAVEALKEMDGDVKKNTSRRKGR